MLRGHKPRCAVCCRFSVSFRSSLLCAARACHTVSAHDAAAAVAAEAAGGGATTQDSSAAETGTEGSAEYSGASAYDQERHIEKAEALLREVYGPQAKLVVHRLTQRRQRSGGGGKVDGDATHNSIHEAGSEQTTALDAEDDAHDGAVDGSAQTASAIGVAPTDGTAAAAPPVTRPFSDFYYRASVTFRLLGFPVELAVVNGLHPKEVIESCLQQALSSDITFIRPSGSGGPNQNNSGGGGSSSNRRTPLSSNADDSTPASLEPHHHRKAGRENTQRNQQTNRRAYNSSSGGHSNGGWYGDTDATHKSRGPRLTPHQVELKAIMDDLRQLCVHFSLSVKFSVKPPFASRRRAREAAVESHGDDAPVMVDKQWRCRCYVKEEWSTIAQARLALEAAGSSPNDAFVRCVSQLRQKYRDELESPAVLEEGVREVAGMVQTQQKTVTATCATESPGPFASPSLRDASTGLTEVPTYRAHIDVTDERGNVSSYTVRRQASPYVAYESAAALALRGEMVWDGETHLLSEGLPTAPLLWRLRWQFDLLVDHICRETGQTARDVAWVEVTGQDGEEQLSRRGGMAHSDSNSGTNDTTDSGHTMEGGNLRPALNGAVGGVALPPVPMNFTGSLYAERSVLVWQTSGGGRYRVEFDTYVQALFHLLDQYGDCLTTLPCMRRGVGEGLLFPSASVLELHVHRHDAFPILQHHHGKLNCYALLGTLTMQLLGCPYGTHFHYDTTTNEYVCTLTVKDGRMSDMPLIQRRSKQKGESWRFACLDAMRENFPRQYAAILDRHPEIDLSADDMARSAHLRALPREKRIPFFINLSVMVMALAEEDLGWRQPRIRLRNMASSLGLPQWTAELEAQVEGEEGRRVVAVSGCFTQMSVARRSLIFRLGKQYFPRELATYRAMRRGDISDPEEELASHGNKLYFPNAAVNSSMVNHVLALMDEQHATSAPTRFTLQARVKVGPPSTDVDPENVDDPAAGVGVQGGLDMRYVEGDTAMLNTTDPLAILRPPRLAYTAQVLGNRGDVLIADFDSDSATTAADAHAVPVLVTALKSASFHLAGGDAETLWTEYETHPLPNASSPRVLAVSLFNQFFGIGASSEAALRSQMMKATTHSSDLYTPATGPSAVRTPSSAGSAASEGTDANFSTLDASITVVTTHLGGYWFGTAVLPRFGMLPIARAVASTKNHAIRDALIAAARYSFPRVLHYAVKHDVAAASMATEVLTHPVVEELPASVCHDILAELARKAASTGPLPPFQLLVKCTKEAYPRRERFIRVQQSCDNTHGFQCRLYLQRGRVVRPGDSQLVGYGKSATNAAAALHLAAVMALENLYETVLYAAVAAHPNYRDPPSESDE
jgi:hypothetical protein